MSASSHNLDRQLDRLVDGELSSAEYRELLASLDEQPDAWRRCALAFLQAQALGGELQVLRGEGLETRQPLSKPLSKPLPQTISQPVTLTDPVAGASSVNFWQNPWCLTAAMAGSFLLALPLGPLFFNRTPATNTQVASDPPTARPKSPASLAQQITPVSRQPLGNLQMVMDGDVGREIDVPYYHVDSAGELLGSDTQASLSPELLRSLEQAGNHVVREQSMMPLDLDDGGRVLVPIDRYRITPVRNRVIQ